MVTSLFDLFMKTLISQCFRKCDEFTSLCGAIRDVNEICKPKSRTKVREKRQHFAEHVAGDFRITTPFTIRHQLPSNTFSAVSHIYFKISVVFLLSKNCGGRGSMN